MPSSHFQRIPCASSPAVPNVSHASRWNSTRAGSLVTSSRARDVAAPTAVGMDRRSVSPNGSRCPSAAAAASATLTAHRRATAGPTTRRSNCDSSAGPCTTTSSPERRKRVAQSLRGCSATSGATAVTTSVRWNAVDCSVASIEFGERPCEKTTRHAPRGRSRRNALSGTNCASSPSVSCRTNARNRAGSSDTPTPVVTHRPRATSGENSIRRSHANSAVSASGNAFARDANSAALVPSIRVSERRDETRDRRRRP